MSPRTLKFMDRVLFSVLSLGVAGAFTVAFTPGVPTTASTCGPVASGRKHMKHTHAPKTDKNCVCTELADVVTEAAEEGLISYDTAVDLAKKCWKSEF